MRDSSPFKFLDSYNKEDKDIFFGWDVEIEKLYELVFQSNLTLVYGESGTGKTSLIQCGLANRFAQSDWFNVYVRRNEDINVSLIETLKRYKVGEKKSSSLSERLKRRRSSTAKKSSSKTEIPKESELKSTLSGLYKYYLKPVYLIFDQFEELFILGSHSEQKLFYQSIADILETEVYCRIIIIMREEMIAQLYNFEKVVPSLFEKRLRVEKMSRGRTEEVISQTTEKFGITLEDDSIPDQIIDVLSTEGQVELTYLQVFLDRLYQEAAKTSSNGINYDSNLIQKLGSIENVLGDFLTRQIRVIQEELESQFPEVSGSAVSKILSTFVTLEGTKRPLAIGQIRTGNLTIDQVGFIIEKLGQSRILRFENDLYELSHDALAMQVAEQRSAEEIALLQIVKLVRDRNQAFEATKTYLNANELQLISGFETLLEEEKSLSKKAEIFVQKSIKVNRRRKMGLAAIVISIFGVLVAFSLYSYKLSITATENANQVKRSLRQLEAAQVQAKEDNYQRFLQEGNVSMALSDYSGALESYRTALTFDSTKTEAQDSIRIAESKSISRVQFDEFIKDGDELFTQNNNRLFVNAKGKYLAALQLGYNDNLAQSKVNQVNGKLPFAFEQFKDDGDVFFEAGGISGFRRALDNYRQAARIKPNDIYIKGQIRKCQQGLGN